MAATAAPIRCRWRAGSWALTTQGYYTWAAAPVSQQGWHDAHLIGMLYGPHADDAPLGYRFLTDELAHEHGITAGENRIHRLCPHRRGHRLASPHAGRSNPGPPAHDDLLAIINKHGVTRHEFTATAPNQVWLTDISEHPAAGPPRPAPPRRHGSAVCLSAEAGTTEASARPRETDPLRRPRALIRRVGAEGRVGDATGRG